MQRAGEHLKTIHEEGLQGSFVKEPREQTLTLEKPLSPREAVSLLLGEFFVCILQMSLRAPLSPFLTISHHRHVSGSTRASLRCACFLCFAGNFTPCCLWLRSLPPLLLQGTGATSSCWEGYSVCQCRRQGMPLTVGFFLPFCCRRL